MLREGMVQFRQKKATLYLHAYGLFLLTGFWLLPYI
ncbi:hypothetical protein Cflav_PD1539 [Pedosphaera parvula Ellin514]|uniref:Uncharacterized protein n=1 Tax=Pedosphaera parvula (strain Ellin514) TaxID=320771 RepID=B9XNH9_PEDPL|nr:hypothetical protein Cflav_PD1539 [Pedosphaera parvula Ellin514]